MKKPSFDLKAFSTASVTTFSQDQLKLISGGSEAPSELCSNAHDSDSGRGCSNSDDTDTADSL
jgi:hypothetical protein